MQKKSIQRGANRGEPTSCRCIKACSEYSGGSVIGRSERLREHHLSISTSHGWMLCFHDFFTKDEQITVSNLKNHRVAFRLWDELTRICRTFVKSMYWMYWSPLYLGDCAFAHLCEHVIPEHSSTNFARSKRHIFFKKSHPHPIGDGGLGLGPPVGRGRFVGYFFVL